MLLTRSIRRKMATGLAVLLVTLGLLSVGGIAGLSKYRRTVKDFEFSIRHAPRNSELIAAIGMLVEPLSHNAPEIDKPHTVVFTNVLTLPAVIVPPLEQIRLQNQAFQQQRRDFERTLVTVRDLVDGQFRQLDHYLEELGQAATGITRLNHGTQPHLVLRLQIRDKLDQCAANLPLLEIPQRREQSIRYMLRMIAELHDAVRAVPDPANLLVDQLARDRQDYNWHLGLVWCTSIASAIMFLSLVFCAQRWVVRPIRELQRGACRVAAGDFDYRIRLNTNDEISKLAGAFNHMTGRFQSVTENLDRQVRQQTQQLVQSARLASVGFLSAGVAHEINNPLHAIATAAEGLEFRLMGQLESMPESDRAVVQEYLSMMQAESARCREITEKLLDFARGKGSERNQYDITAIVDDTVSVLEHVGRFRNRTIHFDVSAPHYAYVNGSEIKQVVLNLIANALEAIDTDGEVRIDIRESPDYVEVDFRDNGCGMAPDVLAHVFDPFFTTKQNKASGKGTGLGLSISYRIVQDHHGTLEAMSDGPGKGTTFRLRLPKTPAASRAA